MITKNSIKRLKIAVLIDNDIIDDYRVLKEAIALQDIGHAVKIFGITKASNSITGTLYGIEFLCLPSQLLPIKWVQSLYKKYAKIWRTQRQNNQEALSLHAEIPLHRKWSILDALKANVIDWLHLRQYYKVFKSSILEFSPDIIHAHDLPCGVASSKLAKLLECKFVYDAHEYESDRHARLPSFAWKHRSKTEQQVCKSASAIITVSNGLAIKLADKYDVPQPLVLYNSPVELTISNKVHNIRTDLNIDEKAQLGIYIGHFRNGRGIQSFLMALRGFPQISFAFIGIDPTHAEAKTIKSFATLIGLKNHIYFIPRKEPWELTKYLRTSTFSVLPIQNSCVSHNYCMPNKLFESVFARVPLIVSPLDSLSEFARRTGFGVVSDGETPETYAQAIQQILGTLDKNRYSSAKFKDVESRYGWDTQAQKLKNLYERLSQ